MRRRGLELGKRSLLSAFVSKDDLGGKKKKGNRAIKPRRSESGSGEALGIVIQGRRAAYSFPRQKREYRWGGCGTDAKRGGTWEGKSNGPA